MICLEKKIFFFLMIGVLVQVDSKFLVNKNSSTEIEKITGGSRVSIENHPYQVLVDYGNKMCGGSIISPNHVLTAAHCVCDGNRLCFVHSGSEKRRSRGRWTEISRKICHERYNEGGFFENDIAILVIGSKFNLKFDDKTQNIPIARKSPTIGDWGKVTGWGFTSNERTLPADLRVTSIQVTDHSHCKTAEEIRTMPGSFCAGTLDGRDSCTGDSGGPFVIDGHLAGIVSLGPPTCGVWYGLYTNVTYYQDWIDEKMDEEIPEGEKSGYWKRFLDLAKGLIE